MLERDSASLSGMRRPETIAMTGRHLLLALGFLALGASELATIEPGTDYGAGLSLKRISSLRDVIAAAERHTSDSVLLRGRISEVCQRKGCWTILEDADLTVRISPFFRRR